MTCGYPISRCYPAYCHLRKTIIMFVFLASFKSINCEQNDLDWCSYGPSKNQHN